MGEKASAILNLRSVFSKGRGIQELLDQTLGEFHLKGKYFKGSKILRRTEDLSSWRSALIQEERYKPA